jgi:hypothetical protein
MRKQIRRRGTQSSSTNQGLQLTRETVRTLTSEELSRVVEAGVAACPTGTDTMTTKNPG